MRNILVLNKRIFWLRMKRFEYFLKKIDVSGVVDIGCGITNPAKKNKILRFRFFTEYD